MRIKLSHRIAFNFAEPARNVIFLLKLTPRSHDGQRIMRWRIDVESDCRLKSGEDHFGNLVHTLTIPGPAARPLVVVSGEIASFDAAGVVRGSAERLPAELFLRDTALTTPDGEIRAFADRVGQPAADRIGRLHRLMGALSDAVVTAPDQAEPRPAAEVFAAGRGSDADLAHVFIACARHLGWPARCVTGYYVPDGEPQTRHTWAEVQVDGLGWVGFDPAHDICPQDMHIRTAVGLDAVDAAGVRGTRLDGMVEAVDATWRFDKDRAAGLAQAQAQVSR